MKDLCQNCWPISCYYVCDIKISHISFSWVCIIHLASLLADQALLVYISYHLMLYLIGNSFWATKALDCAAYWSFYLPGRLLYLRFLVTPVQDLLKSSWSFPLERMHYINNNSNNCTPEDAELSNLLNWQLLLWNINVFFSFFPPFSGQWEVNLIQA